MPWFDLAMLFLVVFAAMMSPGPDMLLVARYSLGTHRGTVALCIAGITTGIGLHLTLALTGLAAIAATAPDALDVLRWLGALWLAWLGFAALRSTGAFSLTGELENPPNALPFLTGLLSNLLNVKVLLMMLALFTELLDPTAPLPIRLAAAGLLMLEVAIVWTVFARLVRRPAIVSFVERNAHRLDQVFGTTLLGLAILVAFAV